MLLVYLQEYVPRALRELSEAVGESFGLDWDARVEACGETPGELLRSVAPADLPALFIMEDAERGALDAAVLSLREQNALHYLILRLSSLQAAVDIRPPYYRVSGFLVSPIDKNVLHRLLEAVYQDYAASRAGYGGFFTLKIRGTAYRLPYSDILFFESSGKKIIARTAAQEYEFYDSLDDISRGVPDFFLRVHRSYCVNGRQIESANFSERTITMRDGSALPFSRAFRQELVDALSVSTG
jgi:DNA-binding LytR/AlgR family response regulator